MKTIVAFHILYSTLFFVHSAYAGVSQASFTPTGYKYPIMKISIMKADGTDAQNLYQCSGATPEDCLVDVSDAAALEALTNASKNVAIKAGVYTRLKLDNCLTNDSTQLTSIQVKGSVLVDNTTTYYTSSSTVGGMSTTNSSEFTQIPWACGGASVNLLNPVTVTADSNQTLNLLVDLTNVVWTDANASSGMGGCKTDGSTGQDICGSFPLIVPFVGSGSPTYERYLVSHLAGSGTPLLADANAAVNFAVDQTGAVFWIGVLPYYSSTSPAGNDLAKGGPDYNTSTRLFSKNSDQSISFQTGGDVTDDRVGFTHFSRSTHTGTCKNEGASSTVWNYQAFKQ